MVRERVSNRVFDDAFLLTPPETDTVIPLESVYPTTQSLEVDVGCGRGRFLLARARACPHLNFLGIDLVL